MLDLRIFFRIYIQWVFQQETEDYRPEGSQIELLVIIPIVSTGLTGG
jgi:hypothetical protein